MNIDELKSVAQAIVGKQKGVLAADDLTVRMSVAAHGADNVARLMSFATALQVASGGGR
mgnify:CR=1 FL=1